MAYAGSRMPYHDEIRGQRYEDRLFPRTVRAKLASRFMILFYWVNIELGDLN